MESTALFRIGQTEVSPAAAEAALARSVDTRTLFARHECGDWGNTPKWLAGANSNAAATRYSFHAIRSTYSLGADCEAVVVTSVDRARTRLMLAEEFMTHELSVADGYALWADTYDYPNPLIGVEEPFFDAVLSRLPAIDSAVDVGTGTGRLAFKVARGGTRQVLGLDATPEMLGVARGKAEAEGLGGLGFKLFELGICPLPVADASVDLVTCGLMLCHLPDVMAAIQDCVRVVRPGGWLILTDFHPATAGFGWRTDTVTPDGVFRLPNFPTTREEYVRSLTGAGCVILEIHDIGLDGEPYGDISEPAMRAKNLPPLCLVILAQKI
jgi:ubiquinone/menaquinone biosynthesis C-methylase UbiE